MHCLLYFRKWGQHSYIVLFSPLSPFQWHQNTWPWMAILCYIFTGCQRSCKPCTSYDRKAVCLSVCLSVTRWHWVKTTQSGITKSSPTDSPRTLVFGIKKSSRNSRGFAPSDGVKWEGVGKIRNFQPITRRISETVQDRTKVTINH